MDYLNEHCIEYSNNKCKSFFINLTKNEYENFQKGSILKVDVLGKIEGIF